MIELLKEKGIDFEELKEVTNQPEAAIAGEIGLLMKTLVAIAESTIHKDAAKQASATADKCLKQVKEFQDKIKYLESTILDFTPKKQQKEIKTQIKTIKQNIKQLQTEEKQQRDIAKEEQTKADAIYWAIYNLDRKNPNSGQDFEHLPPEDLLASILEKDRQVAEIMTEINSIINKQ